MFKFTLLFDAIYGQYIFFRQFSVNFQGSTQEFLRDEASFLLSEMARLKDEMDESTDLWRTTWSDLDVKSVVKKQSKEV